MTVRTATGYIIICDICKFSYTEIENDRNAFIKKMKAKGWDIPIGGYGVRCKCPNCKKQM